MTGGGHGRGHRSRTRRRRDLRGRGTLSSYAVPSALGRSATLVEAWARPFRRCRAYSHSARTTLLGGCVRDARRSDGRYAGGEVMSDAGTIIGVHFPGRRLRLFTFCDDQRSECLAGRRTTPAWARFFAALRSRSHSAVQDGSLPRRRARMGCRSVAGTAPHRFVRQELLSWVSGSAVRQCGAPERSKILPECGRRKSLRRAAGGRLWRGAARRPAAQSPNEESLGWPSQL